MAKTLRQQPPTYKAVKEWVKRNKHWAIPHGCWIADVKKQMGYEVPPAHNRKGADRCVHCPPEKISDIREALEKA